MFACFRRSKLERPRSFNRFEKERDRRYQSVQDLASDIQRFMVDEPITAGPPSKRYRLRKFVARNRVAVVSGLLVLSTLLGGLVATTRALFWAIEERGRAGGGTKGIQTEARA